MAWAGHTRGDHGPGWGSFQNPRSRTERMGEAACRVSPTHDFSHHSASSPGFFFLVIDQATDTRGHHGCPCEQGSARRKSHCIRIQYDTTQQRECSYWTLTLTTQCTIYLLTSISTVGLTRRSVGLLVDLCQASVRPHPPACACTSMSLGPSSLHVAAKAPIVMSHWLSSFQRHACRVLGLPGIP